MKYLLPKLYRYKQQTNKPPNYIEVPRTGGGQNTEHIDNKQEEK